ncbi:glycosyltransferase [Alteromonas stellipolaris]|uniref:glycosyltransferase n=1 Tax=Alteromonas stellipolaris TaxID=233316 RepID=UPI002735AFAE|nr:glycosyltransferase [Alteromonas stellipolaris]MDP2597676.1 glycosyltransferase [Alteromonas stellipolaris]
MCKQNQSVYVDKKWYLETYPDVAAAGIEPAIHFEKHGRREGRIPCELPSLSLERDLWASALDIEGHKKFLDKLIEYSNKAEVNSVYAQKVLTEFFVFRSEYSKALYYSEKVFLNIDVASKLFDSTSLFLLCFESQLKSKKLNSARQLIEHPLWVESNSKLLARQMLNAQDCKLEQLNSIYRSCDLATIETTTNEINIDRIISKKQKPKLLQRILKTFFQKKVSVIVPVFNAEKTIKTSLNSLLSQSWENIEIIVIDDCSTDNTLKVLEEYSAEPNLFVYQNDENKGAYPTRNKGAVLATGDLVTVMDADDWAHPEKIEQQVFPFLFKRKIKATVSHWVRCTEDLSFTKMRIDGSLIYRNISSLMVEKSVFDYIGMWDELRAGADTEFYHRLIANFGQNSVHEVLPDVPLAFGRVVETSLTQSSATHLVTQFGGARQEHLAFAQVWHRNAPIPIKFDLTRTLFPAPTELCPNKGARSLRNADLHRWYRAFDNNWYLSSYPNVDKMGGSIYDHYLSLGERLDMSPNPLFVPSAYRLKFQLRNQDSPTWQALQSTWSFKHPVTLDGDSKNSQREIALFAHSVSQDIFGAEKSFLDIAKALSESGYCLHIFLPNALNESYINELKRYAVRLIFIPLIWFSKGRAASAMQVEYLSNYFEQSRIELVYVNTIMLFEPYCAAAKANIKTVTHVRELPEFDEHIRKVLGEEEEETRERIRKVSTHLVANSNVTAEWLAAKDKCTTVYNVVNVSTVMPAIDVSQPLKVCMLSSNLPKKGVEDFFEVASRCINSKITFSLYGPVTSEVEAASRRFTSDNVRIRGYTDKVSTEILNNDIVLCLSSFKESFGRTAAEAMVHKRVVVGYQWGAIEELVDESSGILVPFKNVEQIAENLKELSVEKIKLIPFAENAKRRADFLFSRSSFNSSIKAIVEKTVLQ